MEGQQDKQPKQPKFSFYPTKNHQKTVTSTPLNQQITLTLLQKYCESLKQYRIQVKPPINNHQIKKQFQQNFDQTIVKRTLSEIGKFIKTRKDRKRSTCQRCTGFLKQNPPIRQKKTESVDQILNIKKSHSEYTQQQNQKQINQPPLNQQLSLKYSSLVNKILLYTWQLCNIRVIITLFPSLQSYSIPQQIIYDIHRLCISTSRIYVSKWGIKHVTVQAMQIAYFNLLKNKIFQVDPDRNGSLCCLIEAILGDTEQTVENTLITNDKIIGNTTNKIAKETQNQQQLKQMIQIKKMEQLSQNQSQQQPKQNPHNPEHHLATIHKKSTPQLQLEWLIYILEYCIHSCQDFIKSTFTQLSNGNIHILSHSAVSLLHFIALLLNKIINDRTTTQIIKGYPCPIQQLKSNYHLSSLDKNTANNSIKLIISITDYQWLLTTLLKQVYKCYKKQLQRLWVNKLSSSYLSTYQNCYIQCIMNIIAIMNCANFLGGYNPHLQKKTLKLVHQFLFQFLQLSFLIYQLCHSKKKNVQLKLTESTQKDYIINLQKILQISNEEYHDKTSQTNQYINPFQQHHKKNDIILTDYKKILPLQYGQLVAIIRLLSNLVHINEQFQKYFQQNLKYFRIIMSLTHELQNQITMKNWAIIFLKYASEQSSLMRAELQKLQIQLKVTNDLIPQSL